MSASRVCVVSGGWGLHGEKKRRLKASDSLRRLGGIETITELETRAERVASEQEAMPRSWPERRGSTQK